MYARCMDGWIGKKIFEDVYLPTYLGRWGMGDVYDVNESRYTSRAPGLVDLHGGLTSGHGRRGEGKGGVLDVLVSSRVAGLTMPANGGVGVLESADAKMWRGWTGVRACCVVGWTGEEGRKIGIGRMYVRYGKYAGAGAGCYAT